MTSPSFRTIVAVFIAVIATSQWWEVSWQPHPHNRYIRLVYTCPEYYALNLFEVREGITSMSIRRHPLPKGRCWVFFDLLRSPEKDAIPEELPPSERHALEVKEDD